MKKYIVIAVATAFFTLLSLVLAKIGVFNPHHRLAKDPDNLERVIDVDMPDSRYVTSDELDYIECFIHETQFVASLTDTHIRELDRLCETEPQHWMKGAGEILCYRYQDQGKFHHVTCLIYDDYAIVEYTVDEDEGMGAVLLCLLIIVVMVAVLLLWGVVLLVKSLSRKRRMPVQ